MHHPASSSALGFLALNTTAGGGGCRQRQTPPWPRAQVQGSHDSHFSLTAFWKFTFLFCRLFFSLGQLSAGREQEGSQAKPSSAPSLPTPQACLFTPGECSP